MADCQLVKCLRWRGLSFPFTFLFISIHPKCFCCLTGLSQSPFSPCWEIGYWNKARSQMSRCHFTVVPGWEWQQKVLNSFFFGYFIQKELQKMWQDMFACLLKTRGMDRLHISAYLNERVPTPVRQHENASPHTLRCSASLLDNILARVSHPPDSDTAFASAASLEMHISLLVVPHSWPNWFNWSARSNGEHMLGDWQLGRS